MHLTQLRPSLLTDLPSISTWVKNQEECDLWSGGVVPFPIDLSILPRQIIWDSAQSWTLEASAEIVGYGQIVPKQEGRLHLARILVDPDERGNGFGRQLVTHLLHKALENGAPVVSLNVHPVNSRATGLYLSLGFKPVSNFEASHKGAFVYMEFKSVIA